MAVPKYGVDEIVYCVDSDIDICYGIVKAIGYSDIKETFVYSVYGDRILYSENYLYRSVDELYKE